MADNLMLHGAVARRGQSLIVEDAGSMIAQLSGFKRALAQAVAHFRRDAG